MRMMAIICMLSSVLLVGCWDERLYKNLSVISVAGIEGEVGDVTSYYAYPNSPNDPTKFNVIEAHGITPRENRSKADLKIEQTIDLSELTTLLIEKETAYHDIYTYLDLYYRNAQNPITSKIVLTEGSPKDFLSFEKPLPTEIGEYYQDFIESFERTTIFPEGQNMQRAAPLFFDEAIDVTIPYIKRDEQNGTPVVAGLALFNNRIFSGTILSIKEALLVNLLARGKADTARMTFLYDDDGKKVPLTIDIIRFKKMIKQQGNSKKINLNVEFKVNIDEFPQNHISNKRVRGSLQKFLEKEIKNDINNMLQKCQEAPSDPIGIGRKIRAGDSPLWKEGHWKKTYKTLEFDTKVQVIIVRSGIFLN